MCSSKGQGGVGGGGWGVGGGGWDTAVIGLCPTLLGVQLQAAPHKPLPKALCSAASLHCSKTWPYHPTALNRKVPSGVCHMHPPPEAPTGLPASSVTIVDCYPPSVCFPPPPRSSPQDMRGLPCLRQALARLLEDTFMQVGAGSQGFLFAG